MEARKHAARVLRAADSAANTHTDEGGCRVGERLKTEEFLL